MQYRTPDKATWNSPAPFALTQLKANLTRGILVAYPITGILLGVATIIHLLGEEYLDIWVMADVLPFLITHTAHLLLYCMHKRGIPLAPQVAQSPNGHAENHPDRWKRLSNNLGSIP